MSGIRRSGRPTGIILLLTDSNKLLMQWGGPYIVESCVGANDYRLKMRSKTKTYDVNNMLKKYIAGENRSGGGTYK